MAKYIEIVPGIYVMSFGKLNAKIEEPHCSDCENYGYEAACSKCGEEHAWANYSREFLYLDCNDRPIYYTKGREIIPYSEAKEAIGKYYRDLQK